MKQIILVNDLSGLGNCSLAANLAVFSAMGMQGCPLPTAVLTNQSCYDSYQEMLYQPDFLGFAREWKSAGVCFDGIYSGYFRDTKQMAAFEDAFLDAGENILYFNDPVMGDLGKPYDNCCPAMSERMRLLVSRAALTTPNLTELCILTGQDYHALLARKGDPDFLEQVARLAGLLIVEGAKQVIVTGVKWKADQLYNIHVTEKETCCYATTLLDGDYSGTGDLFSSVVSAGLLQGRSAAEMVQLASRFIEKAIRYTAKHGKNGNDGLQFQPFLGMLTGE